jgi:predicted nucleotidyltransferase
MAEARPQEIAENLDAVVEQIRSRFQPAKVILFGSYASGQPNADSDVDLLVVTPAPPNWREAHRFGMELESRFGLRLHLQFMREEEFEETRDVVGGLAFPASRTGKMLYEQKP